MSVLTREPANGRIPFRQAVAVLAVAIAVLGASAALPFAADASTPSFAQETAPKKERKKDKAAKTDAARAAATETAVDYDCIDFDTREDAQAVLDADPSDPHKLDPNLDGIACALLPSRSDLASGAAPVADAAAAAPAAQDQATAITCADLTQEEAMTLLQQQVGDPAVLDPNGNGIACETDELQQVAAQQDPAPANGDKPKKDRKNRKDQQQQAAPVDAAQAQQAQPAPSGSVPEDLDCIDFQFQEEAQLVYEQDPTDPYNLDPNADGYACSSLQLRNPVNVSVVPATGSGPAAGMASAAAAMAAAGTALGIVRQRRRAAAG